MSRHPLALVVSLVLSTTVASADTFAGWRYTAPPGYRTETTADHVALTKIWGARFCSISIFEPRVLESSLEVEQAYEWHNIVAQSFSAKILRRGTLEGRSGTITTTTALLTDARDNRYAGVHYVVAPPGMVGSVLLTASSRTELPGCARVAAAVASSLEIDWTAPAFYDPEARVETPQGRWAIAGSMLREYTFAANGTYRFHSETTGPDPVRVIEETGTYAVRGNQLSLVPKQSTVATIAGGIARTTKGSLERATYSWRKTYRPDTNEWRILLSPLKETARDGKFPAGGHDYSYSDRDKPAWRYAPQPGV